MRLAFVSAPGCSAFMEELLAVVADAVTGLADPQLEVVMHRGYVADVVDHRTVAVVIPHEYFAIAPEPLETMSRVIALGVEHPGTTTFRRSTQMAARLGAWFEIAESSRKVLAKAGHHPRHFPMGYAARWDRWGGAPVDRPVDIVYLGTADPRRLEILAGSARALSSLRCELLMPPHEPMTTARPDFLLDEQKWELLARSKLLINLHREEKQAFEWVRALEAISNGCVVLTEPSDDLGPLRPGEHLLVAQPRDLGDVARAVLEQPQLLQDIADNAYWFCREQLDMAGPAAELVRAARELNGRAVPAAGAARELLPTTVTQAGAPAEERAWWPGIPRDEPMPTTAQMPARGPIDGLVEVTEGLAVLCAQRIESGPWRLTQRSLGASARLYVARNQGAELQSLDSPPHHLACTGPDVGLGAARNVLLREVTEDLVAVLDAGDQVLGDALDRMVAMLRADPSLDAVVCPAVHGDGPLVNVLVPEMWRLDARAYLSRGYVVRRAALEAVGGFVEDPEWEELVDHYFWVSFTRAGRRCGLLREVGLELWPRQPQQAAV